VCALSRRVPERGDFALLDDLNTVDTVQRGHMQLTVSAVGKTVTVPATGEVK
jgi:hypothetical protein